MKKILVLVSVMLMGVVQSMNAQNESDECGKLIVPAVYDYIEAGDFGLFAVGTLDKNGNSLGNKKGVVDSNGKVIVPIKYQSVSLGKEGDSCGGLIEVGNKVLEEDFYRSVEGLFNKDGIQLIPIGKYRSISIKNHHGYNGLAIITSDSGSCIRFKDGTMSPYYDNISQVESGLFAVRKDGLYGALNQNGEVIIPIKYDGISMKFDNGLIEVNTPYQDGGRKYGVFNDKGEVVVPVGKYESVDINQNYIVVKKGGKKGVLNQKGMEIVPIGMYENCRISECFELNQYYVEIKTNNNKGAVNESGKVFIPIGKYEEFRVLNPNLAYVKLNGKMGIIDKNGVVIVPFGKYDDLSYRYGVLTYSQNGKWGVLGENGNQATPAEYDNIEPARHSKGMAFVVKDGKIGVINNEGKLVVPLGNYNGGDIANDIIMLKSPDGNVFANTNGESLLPIGIYECAENSYGKLNTLKVDTKQGLFLVEVNGKNGVLKLW